MPITRDADFPTEMADLMKAMNACCEGHRLEVVEQAAANMLSAAIHNGAKMRGVPDERFGDYARAMLQSVLSNAVLNWNRQPQPADVPVSAN